MIFETLLPQAVRFKCKPSFFKNLNLNFKMLKNFNSRKFKKRIQLQKNYEVFWHL